MLTSLFHVERSLITPTLFHSYNIELVDSTVRVKKNDADIRSAFPKCVCGAVPATNWKASSTNRKVSSEKAEGFFRRALGLNTNKFLKRGAASLLDLPGLHLHLPEMRLCLLSRVNNGKAEQQQKGFHKRTSVLKTRTVYVGIAQTRNI